MLASELEPIKALLLMRGRGRTTGPPRAGQPARLPATDFAIPHRRHRRNDQQVSRRVLLIAIETPQSRSALRHCLARLALKSPPMHGLMMDYQLTVNGIFRRAEAFAKRREIVTRLPDRSIHRYTYDDFAQRARRLASALKRLGLRPGDRIATLGWNHSQHLEAYFGIPLAGGVLHTLNLRLHPDELAYIVSHAGDRIVLVDECLLPLWDKVRPQVNVRTTIVVQASN